jgi:AcrR family transcriptional regulator
MMNTVQHNGFTEGSQLGVKERQEREREAVSRAILDAARDLFVAEGYQNVSIRKIADRIEYSPAAIYSYFPSKDDIFFALAEEGFRLLFAGDPNEQCIEGDDPSDPIAAVRGAFWHFYQFSRKHPEYFALMFVDRSVPRISHLWERFSFISSMKARLTGLIQKAIDSGQLPKGVDPHTVFRILSTAVLGAAVTQLCNRLAPGEDAEALARDTLEAALTGLRTGFDFKFRPTACGEPSSLRPRDPDADAGASARQASRPGDPDADARASDKQADRS